MITNKHIFIVFILLVSAIVFFGISDIDLFLEDYLYNFQTKEFIVDFDTQPYRFIFYDGIKKLLIIFAVSLLLGLIIFWKTSFLKPYKKGVFIILLSAIFIPAVVGFLKDTTNMPCPEDELRYGGDYIRTAVWECYPENFELKNDRIKCWPAGHASGGFALMSLYFLFRKNKNKYLALSFGIFIGWSMGLYKMATGDHFFSHTLITMLLSWFIIIIISRFVESVAKRI